MTYDKNLDRDIRSNLVVSKPLGGHLVICVLDSGDCVRRGHSDGFLLYH